MGPISEKIKNFWTRADPDFNPFFKKLPPGDNFMKNYFDLVRYVGLKFRGESEPNFV